MPATRVELNGSALCSSLKLTMNGDLMAVVAARIPASGTGTPPVLTQHGWLVIYHGVSEVTGPSDDRHHLRYSAGVMVLSKQHPREIRYRSVEPILTPMLPRERSGAVANVVFPTGIDRRDDVGLPNRFDVYYGMADDCIGVARLDLPDCLPSGGIDAQPAGKV